jgi:Tol biopolymer transport system component
MPADGGAAAQVTRNGGVKVFESEDGKTIYFNKESGAGSIWKRPAEGGKEEMLAESLYRFNFAVAKKGIYYMTAVGEDGNAELKFYSFANGSSSTVTQMGYPEFGLDVSPDGRYLIYAQLDDWASDLMLVENFR